LIEAREAFECQDLNTRQARLQMTPQILLLLNACFDLIQVAYWWFTVIKEIFCLRMTLYRTDQVPSSNNMDVTYFSKI